MSREKGESGISARRCQGKGGYGGECHAREQRASVSQWEIPHHVRMGLLEYSRKVWLLTCTEVKTGTGASSGQELTSPSEVPSCEVDSK